MLTYVEINRLEGNEDIELPRKMSELASGFDLYAAVQEGLVLEPGKRCLVPTGLAIAMPAGLEAQIRPRSAGSQAWYYLS